MDFGEKKDYVMEKLMTSWDEILIKFAKSNPNKYKNVEKIINDTILNYTRPNRYYHNIEHIANMLERFEINHKTFNKIDVSIMESAIIHHDVIYNIQRNSNTQTNDINVLQSANYAINFYKLFLPELYVNIISDYILLTDYIKYPIGYDMGDIKKNYIRDLDLYSFGNSTIEESIERQMDIRKEYANIDTKTWASQTVPFLKRLLELDKIYLTNFFYDVEKNARRNIKAVIISIENTPTIFNII